MPPPPYLGTYRPLLLLDGFSHGAVGQVDHDTPILSGRPWLEEVRILFEAATPAVHGIDGFWLPSAGDLEPNSRRTEDASWYELAPSVIGRSAMVARGPFTIPIQKFSPFLNPRWHTRVLSDPAEAATFQFAWLFYLESGPRTQPEVKGSARVIVGVVAPNQRGSGH